MYKTGDNQGKRNKNKGFISMLHIVSIRNLGGEESFYLSDIKSSKEKI